MNKAIYIATSEHNRKSIITLGLMSMLIGKTAKVGYFRPIIEDFEDGKLIIIKPLSRILIRHCI
jgi:phosphate acetyltransferase